MMKVLFLTNIPSPYRVEFFNELGKRCDLTVWYEYKKEPTENRDASWEDDNAKNYIAKYLYKFKDFKKFDIVIICGVSTSIEIKALCYLKFFRIPYYLEIDGGFPKTKEKFITKNIKKFLISGAKGYFSTADMADRYLIKYGADQEKIFRYHFSSVKNDQVLKKGISAKKKESLKLELGLKQLNTILYVGRFIPFKRIDLLLKAAKNMKCQIVLIGGELTDQLQMLVSENELKLVRVIPFVKYDELRKYYWAADVFVFPTENDIWGLVVNEAMANALPVISSTGSIAGLELVNEEENGFLFKSGDFKDLRKKIDSFFCLPLEKRLSMQERALKMAESYTIEEMVEDHINIFMGIRDV